MDSLDTNILARYYLGDHPEQSAAAQALLEGGGLLWVSSCVVLELCWLLDSRYGLKRDNIVAVLRHLLRLDAVRIENEDAVAKAVESYAQGIDIADALHLALSAHCKRLLTFDEKFAKRAKRLKLSPPCLVPQT